MTPEDVVAKFPGQWVAIQRGRIIASSKSLNYMVVTQLPLLGEFAHQATVIYVPGTGEPTEKFHELFTNALDR